MQKQRLRKMSYFCYKVLVMILLALVAVSADFDFYYFVLQWPASYCDTKKSCCYPTTGKPAEDFGIHGLWPNYNNGSYPSNCDSSNSFDASQISDLKSTLQENWPTLACPSGDGYKFWGHEWDKHGTCAESFLDQHSYFEKSLDLKLKANILQALKAAGITPADGVYYTLGEIKDAIKDATGYNPFIECNVDTSGNRQLYQVYMCVEKTATDFMDCPVFPGGRPCGSGIEFPSFSGTSLEAI